MENQGLYVKVSRMGFYTGEKDAASAWSFDVRQAKRFAEPEEVGEFMLMPYFGIALTENEEISREKALDGLPADEQQLVKSMQKNIDAAVHTVATPRGIMSVYPYNDGAGEIGIQLSFGRNGAAIYVQYDFDKEAIGIHIYEDHDADAKSLYVDMFGTHDVVEFGATEQRIQHFLASQDGNHLKEMAVIHSGKNTGEISYDLNAYLSFNADDYSEADAANVLEQLLSKIEDIFPQLSFQLFDWQRNA